MRAQVAQGRDPKSEGLLEIGGGDEGDEDLVVLGGVGLFLPVAHMDVKVH